MTIAPNDQHACTVYIDLKSITDWTDFKIKNIDVNSPLYIYNQQHIFELDQKKLVGLMNSFLPKKWGYIPWINRKDRKDIAQTYKIVDEEDETKCDIIGKLERDLEYEWVDCFFDIECYNCVNDVEENTINGIQKPYLIYFYNPEYSDW